MNSKILPFLAIIAFFSFTAFAQTDLKPKKVIKGIINGSATNLPKPVYPAAAAAVKAGGEVKVSVVVDEIGNVVSAEAVSGHPLLRSASIEAAKLAKFRPTLLSGEPVIVTGMIIYNFVLPEMDVAENKRFEENKGFEVETFPMAFGVMFSIYNNIEPDEEFLDIINEMFAELNMYYDKPKIQGKFSEKSLSERNKIFEEIKLIIKKEFNISSNWQFQMGDIFGEFLAKLITNIQNNKLSTDAELRSSLIKINELILLAPADFPKPVLEKFKEIGNFSNRKNLSTQENQEELFKLLEETFELLSPE